MALYLVGFSGRLTQHAAAARAELRKWGATRLWDDVWVVEMRPKPQACLPGFLQTEAAFSIPLDGADAFFSIGRAAGAAAQLAYTEQVARRLRTSDATTEDLAHMRYCNGGEAVFAPALAHYLGVRRTVNWATDLCRLMAHHGSDKGIGWHTYTPFYQALFLDRRDTIAAVFELGLGTNNEDTPSNMGSHGTPGASLRAWRDYFPNARIYGGDVDKRILFADDRIRTFYVDQSDAGTFQALWANMPDVEFDFFLDDGLHTMEAARTTLKHSIGKVKSGGFYIIEDIANDDLESYLDMIREEGLPGLTIKINHPANIFDNCLAVAAIP